MPRFNGGPYIPELFYNAPFCPGCHLKMPLSWKTRGCGNPMCRYEETPPPLELVDMTKGMNDVEDDDGVRDYRDE